MTTKLIKELSKFGTIQVIKNEFVFTLYMTKNKESLASGLIPLKVLDIVTQNLGKEKSNIEVMKNDEDYLLLILKP